MSADQSNPNGACAEVLLWGDTNSGKTSLVLGLAYLAAQKPDLIKLNHSDSTTAKALHRDLHRLNRGLPIFATAYDQKPLEFRTKSNGTLRIIDIRGEIAGTTDLPSQITAAGDSYDFFKEKSKTANAVVFVLDFSPGAKATQNAALRTSVTWLETREHAYIAFTKCDQTLQFDDVNWQKRPGWWKSLRPQLSWLTGLSEILETFEDRVWPTSLFGFSAETKEPAAYLTEFGELSPWNVQPRNILELFLDIAASRGDKSAHA